MKGMFSGCKNLTKIDLSSNFIKGNVKNMDDMFYQYSSLELLNLQSFFTDNLASMKWMFYKCTNLRKINNMNNFNTTKITNMKWIFCGCEKLS